MRRLIKTFFCIALLTMAGRHAWSFSLLGPSLGPDATWQTAELGYNLGSYDVGAPKQIAQGYRRNAPTNYYAFDYNFLTFFGTNGVTAVNGAFAIMNSLTNADKLQLSHFPDISQESYDASAFLLSDLKSYTLGELMEQMGLAPSVRYVWAMHDRYIPAGASCNANPGANGTEYLVEQRSLDPISQVYSDYINSTLYSFNIWESCGKLGVFPDVITGLTIDSVAIAYPVDTEANTIEGTYSPVTEAVDIMAQINLGASLEDGDYYTGLTYDDAGGLRYLYSTNNWAVEMPAPGSLLEATNGQLQLLQTSDLASLIEFSKTNPPAAVQAQFPGIEISSFSTYFTFITNPVVSAYFTNYPGSPAGTPPTLVIKTNQFTITPQTDYAYTFGNVVIVTKHTNSVAQLQTISLSEPPGSPAGTPPVTKVTYKKIILTNVISGDYYLIPPGSCGYDIYATPVSNYLAGITTNVIASATNTTTVSATNGLGGFVGSESLITYFTNNWYEVFACNFQTPTPQLYQGVGKITFIEAQYDSDLGQNYQPITNDYTMVEVTNSQAVVQHFQRIITQPDILMDAEDLASPNVTQIGTGYPPIGRSISFALDPQLPGSVSQSGPGTITDYPTTFVYNDAGNVLGFTGGVVNQSPAFLSEAPSIFTWASYDSSTNPPIIYPDTSLQNLEGQILIQIQPSSLPDATNGVAYSQTFTTTGGSFTPPYSWSLGINQITQTPTSLPAGLTLYSTNSVAIISGTPTNNPVGPYDFVLKMTDYNGRGVTWNYTINIDQ